MGFFQPGLDTTRACGAVEGAKESAVAVINDDSTEVGYVHFGVVHIIRLVNETIVGRRSGIVAPEFVPIVEAVQNVSSYESWSRLCLEHLDLLLSKATASAVTYPKQGFAAQSRPEGLES